MPGKAAAKPRSQQQRRLMWGIATGNIPAGGKRPTKVVAKEFAESDKPGKLPKRVQKKRKKR